RRPRGDATDQRQPAGRDRLPRGLAQDLERPWLRRVPPQYAQLLEVGEVRVHGRRRAEADRLPDVAHRRRVAMLGRVALDEVEDLLLALRELQVHHGCEPPGPVSERVFAE